MSGNKWHFKDKERPDRTLCGRRKASEGFDWTTARKITDDEEVFRKNPCVFCLRKYKYVR
ncbi:unnamed protein product [marine sediment metagenome]|uniref:Uncharacterized protein n=1 Tax=marine sediment metagenome TaxID=412755 RepID=X1D6I2_9ZZZZ